MSWDEAREVMMGDGSTQVVVPPDEVIEGKLWIGGSPVEEEFVRVKGVTLVVDVADADSGTSPDVLQEAGVGGYVKDPLVDGEELPDLLEVGKLVQRVVDGVESGERVYVCCSFGKNRSGFVVALALREILGCSGEEALSRLRDHRENAVNNAGFYEYVTGLSAPRKARVF